MTPLYLALMGLDPQTGKAELLPDAGVDFLGGVHGDAKVGGGDHISEPAVRNWVLSLASSIVHLLQKPAASIVAAYPPAAVEEEADAAGAAGAGAATGTASPSSVLPPAGPGARSIDADDWAAIEAEHRYPEAHRPRHVRGLSAQHVPLAGDGMPRRRSLRSGDTVPSITVPVLQSTVDDSAVPYTYGQQAPVGPDPATLAAFLHYNYPSFSMMHVPARDHTTVHNDNTVLQHQRTPLKVQCIVRCRIPTEDNRGTFYLHYYINNRDGEHHMAIVYGDDLKSATLEAERKGETDFDRIARGATMGPSRAVENGEGPAEAMESDLAPPLIRIHSACFTGETVGSARCDCAEQLQEAMRQIQHEGRGVVVYLRQEGRGIGLADKMRWAVATCTSLLFTDHVRRLCGLNHRAYNLQDLGHDTVNANLALHLPADARTYEVACLILEDLGIDRVRLLTNNPEKIQGLVQGGMNIVETRSMIPMKWQALMGNGHANEDHGHQHAKGAVQGNRCPSPPEGSLPEIKELDGYLLTKIERMGHRLDVPQAVIAAASKKTAATL